MLEHGDDLTLTNLAKFHGQCVSLESSEPAALGALVTQCHNELCAGEGFFNDITPLPILDRLFKNWFDIDQTPQTRNNKKNYAMTLLLFIGFFIVSVAYFWRAESAFLQSLLNCLLLTNSKQ